MTQAPTTGERIPLNTFAISFGLVGLAGTWTATAESLHLPDAIAETFWGIAFVAWLVLLVIHLVAGRRSLQSLATQIRHPTQGPFAAVPLVVGLLLSTHLIHVAPIVGSALIIVFLVLLTAFIAWFIAQWLLGHIAIESLHGGYFLPVVAAPFIAALSMTRVGAPALAVGLFGIGVFFWILVMGLFVTRLMLHPPLPAPLLPTLAILVAPPAVAGNAMFALGEGTGARAQVILAALLVLMLAVQVALIPVYRHLQFSLGFWSFTFSPCAAATFAITWISIARPPGWFAWSITLVIVVTALVAVIAIRSTRLAVQSHMSRVASTRGTRASASDL
ncbi:hypothetical protein [Naasia lichenicola]|uniref:Transporter n=1 Tax=Naasia lichenicola TaxID=2565933 RepID=A0A4S4FQL4_9MICO|nr:hypothetical protein [Naasia lichenicola]THG32859.1 hypothetical protein E6C64_00310 [Naasia lichenicola]